MSQQAWSFKTIKHEDLRYHGNNGYDDDYSKNYRYDNDVGNHKNVKVGDLVIITDRDVVLGVSLITELKTSPKVKSRNKCPFPGCDAKKLVPRKKLLPLWRCSNNHKFDKPLILNVNATEFTAEYGTNFKKIDFISMDLLKENTLRYNGQSSIQEINFEWIDTLLNLNKVIDPTIGKHDADDNVERNCNDERKILERSIKQRRGQRKFRETLLSKNPRCAITGCELVDILEAAHIDAYRNNTHNHISNGILLRSDLHTLFDLNLMAIDPTSLTVHFSKLVKEKYYMTFEDNKIEIKHSLSTAALEERWASFILML
ncbi:HNH endonuclease signature motif containing protein [Erwinia sp. HDF1-3R]|uniref:HNH endonuclease n=1 Tax=Erwinia sp. HDF1-3R TaxID=3141543 RepID=UPI0031F4E14D